MPHPNTTTHTHVKTYRVKVTTYPDGRKRTLLVPANSASEAENIVRRRIPSKGGYNFDTQKVADYWRERND